MSLAEQTAMEFTAAFFDASSEAWHANKIRRGHCYVYKCEATTLAGTHCKHPAATASAADPSATKHLCKTHFKSNMKASKKK
jgi:hypothetical protein